MSEIVNSVTIRTTYTGTTETRKYKVNGVASDQLTQIESTINRINASLAGGTAGGLSATFVSDNFDPSSGIGYLAKIDQAIIQSVETTPINW